HSLWAEHLPWPPPDDVVQNYLHSEGQPDQTDATVRGPFWCCRCRLSLTSEASLKRHHRSVKHLNKQQQSVGSPRSRSPSPVAGVDYCIECGLSVRHLSGGLALHRATSRHYVSVAKLMGMYEAPPQLPPPQTVPPMLNGTGIK
ncbi:hypothetical protein BOX15_Mlig020256g4, partial [Macrostomum lignano]